jgi:hypothetical protein
MDMLVTLTLRVLSLSVEPSAKQKADTLLEAMRETTLD